MPRGRRPILSLVPLLVALTGLLSIPGGPDATAQPLPRVRFVPGEGGSLLVHGTYPRTPSPCVRPPRPVLHARYGGPIEVGRDADGSLFLIGILPFEEYLMGIAEVPRSWPMEALKAQVVAARSYALRHLDDPDPTGDRLGYQLCATTACQVFVGMAVSNGPYGDRWRRAVRETRGEILVYEGRPADTVYSSTSSGRTLGNEEVFGGDPLPYLRPVEERDDRASPVSRWRVRMPLSDLARFLQRAGRWGGGPIESIRRRGSTVVVRGGGRREAISVADFRSDLNFWAPCLEPDRYPSVDVDGRLPQAVPSRWFRLSREGGVMVLRGRGWGHGVGMVQWGAYGKARRGLSYRDILASYYGGLRPTRYPTPRRIRVGIAVGLQSVTVTPTGPVRVVGRSPGDGPWRITGGRGLRIRPGRPPPPSIAPGRILGSPGRTRAGRTITVAVALPQLSVVRPVLRVDGRDLPLGPAVTRPAGTAELEARVPRVPTGTYELRVETTNGVDVVLTDPRAVRVRGTAPPSPSASPSPTPSPPPSLPRALPTAPAGPVGLPALPAVAAGVAGGLLAALAGWWALHRRSRG